MSKQFCFKVTFLFIRIKTSSFIGVFSLLFTHVFSLLFIGVFNLLSFGQLIYGLDFAALVILSPVCWYLDTFIYPIALHQLLLFSSDSFIRLSNMILWYSSFHLRNKLSLSFSFISLIHSLKFKSWSTWSSWTSPFHPAINEMLLAKKCGLLLPFRCYSVWLQHSV